ncbi:Peptidase S8/S53 domain-containing protein [Desulfonema limicola]|uniref:Peptidase S8/S53 domain-containing protein n=1 Tax=Desulfonema limicola TaxID=45656 RepID=A0A975GHV4_9BACT|nr:S8 family serine peptidase [Desulfonema limicola]QTA81960.1 Peptidase S8/S53 domain-containing protein [Desulfonema limicola]
MVIFAGIVNPAISGSLELHLEGERLTLHAESAGLQDILRAIAKQGIAVQVDPLLNPEISISFYNKDIQQGLKSIFKSLGYVLIWESVSGSSDIYLAEIQVFEQGRKAFIKPLKIRDSFDIARNPENGSLFVRDEILLRRKMGMPLAEFEKIINNINGIITDKNDVLGIYKVQLPENTDIPALVKELGKISNIAGAEPNYAYPISLPYRNIAGNPSFPEHNFSFASAGTASVAVLDSGLLPGYGLDELVVASLDAVNPENSISDGLGHGTQMALIASGVIKPDGVLDNDKEAVPVIPIRAFDDNGVTSSFSIMNSIDFALEKGARVLSLSWGSDTKSKFLEQAMEYADSKNLIVVASAGNEPTGKPVWPAAFPSVICVGALGPDGKPWDKSNYGSFVDLSAPGFASMPIGYKGEPGAYAGTSIATAYVTNIIARYLSKHPGASKQEVLTKGLGIKDQ